MDESCYGDKFVCGAIVDLCGCKRVGGGYCCCVYAFDGTFACEAETVVMGEEKRIYFVTVPCLAEVYGYVVGAEVLASRFCLFGICDIFVICDTTVLGEFYMVACGKQVCRVFVASIVCVESELGECSRLAVISASSVQVVEKETCAEFFACIGGKVGPEAVVAGDFVARIVVAEVGVWRFCVGKVELVYRGHEIVIGLEETEFGQSLAVEEYSCQSW